MGTAPWGPQTTVPLLEVKDGFQQASFLSSYTSISVLGREDQGSVWRNWAADGQRQHVLRRQEAAPGAVFRAQHWQPCTLLEAGGPGARAGCNHPSLAKAGRGPAGREESANIRSLSWSTFHLGKFDPSPCPSLSLPVLGRRQQETCIPILTLTLIHRLVCSEFSCPVKKWGM